MIEEYVRLYAETTDQDRLQARIAAQERRIDNAGRKKAKLLQLSADGMISDPDFRAMIGQCNAEIAEAEARIEDLNGRLQSGDAFKEKIDAIRRVLAEAQRDAARGVIGREFVEKYIDRILVTPQAGNEMRLEIRIFTGESAEKRLKRGPSRGDAPAAGAPEAIAGAGRTGHMFKKMIEAQERQMSGGTRY